MYVGGGGLPAMGERALADLFNQALLAAMHLDEDKVRRLLCLLRGKGGVGESGGPRDGRRRAPRTLEKRRKRAPLSCHAYVAPGLTSLPRLVWCVFVQERRACRGAPVVSVYLNASKPFGFVELASASLATATLQLDGLLRLDGTSDRFFGGRGGKGSEVAILSVVISCSYVFLVLPAALPCVPCCVLPCFPLKCALQPDVCALR